jgi:hypothetical protein
VLPIARSARQAANGVNAPVGRSPKSVERLLPSPHPVALDFEARWNGSGVVPPWLGADQRCLTRRLEIRFE